MRAARGCLRPGIPVQQQFAVYRVLREELTSSISEFAHIRRPYFAILAVCEIYPPLVTLRIVDVQHQAGRSVGVGDLGQFEHGAVPKFLESFSPIKFDPRRIRSREGVSAVLRMTLPSAGERIEVMLTVVIDARGWGPPFVTSELVW